MSHAINQITQPGKSETAGFRFIIENSALVTMAGQAHGLALDGGEDLIVAETLDDLALKVVALIDDFDRLNALQNRAFAKCQEHFAWPVRGAQLLEALRGVAADPSFARKAPAGKAPVRASITAAASSGGRRRKRGRGPGTASAAYPGPRWLRRAQASMLRSIQAVFS